MEVWGDGGWGMNEKGGGVWKGRLTYPALPTVTSTIERTN
jgi:hypothetical protein